MTDFHTGFAVGASVVFCALTFGRLAWVIVAGLVRVAIEVWQEEAARDQRKR